MSAREKIAGLFPSRSLGESVADEILAEHRAELVEEWAQRLTAWDRPEAADLLRRTASPKEDTHDA